MTLINDGKLVRIRPIIKDDLETFVKWKASSEGVAGFDTPSISSVEIEQKKWSEHNFITKDFAIYAIETKKDNKIVGKVGYSKDGHETAARTISFIGEVTDRGKGYATEARILLINYLFISTNMERIYSETEEENKTARRSLEKSGMKFEGVLRHLFFYVGRWNNMAVYSILREEWEKSELYQEYRTEFTKPWFNKGK